MSFRGGRGGGRGRGRGRGRGFGGFVKREPYVLFPDIDLPEVSPEIYTNKLKELPLIVKDTKLRSYWRNSPYYIEEEEEEEENTNKSSKKVSQCSDIERYCDRHNVGPWTEKEKQLPFSYYMKLHTRNFPEELLRGTKRSVQHKKVIQVWDSEKEKKAYDFFEKLEKTKQGEIEKKEKKKGDEDKENDNEEGNDEKEDSEFSDDGDYNENDYVDDDEDDFNMDEGVDDIEDNMFG